MATRRKRTEDSFGRKAKQQGYPARSIYKLEEIDRRLRLLRPGMRVLDLGASPGSWALYAADRVGVRGKVLGIDLNPPRTALPPQARIEQRDVLTVTADELGGQGAFDLVLSDMAPRTTGARNADQYRSFELYMRALELAGALLVPGGNFVGKIFQGAEFEQARAATRARFEEARILKPDASRAESYEVFLVGRCLRALPPPAG
jgi:23S rRNA (uridine2552-2'-O)-methyltransferase